MITIEEHEGMNGVVILTCEGRTFHFAEWVVECGPWFKIPSHKGPTFLNCETIVEALKIVKGIMEV